MSVGAPAARRAGAAVIRRIRPTDAARMRALRLEMLADSPLAFLETVAEAAARPHSDFAAWVAKSATGPEVARFVAEADGRLVGHLGAMRDPANPNRTLIFGVYLTPAFRNRSLLEELMGAAAEWSRSAGRHELLLEVAVGNVRAQRAYRRLGFVDTGVRVRHPRIPVLTEMQMSRRV